MHSDPSELQLIFESIKFTAWLLGSILSLSITLLGIYLRMYVKTVLQDHTEVIQKVVADCYVRRDVYEADVRWLRAQIQGQEE
jgi:hypothetical protein